MAKDFSAEEDDTFSAEAATRPAQATRSVDPERPEGFISAFGTGVLRGFRRDAAALKGVVGLAGSAIGLESGTELLQSAARDLKRAEQVSPRGVESITDVDSLGEAATYAGDVLGEGTASLATSLLGGGVTGAVGKTLARKAVGTVAEKAAEAAAKRSVVGGIVTTGVGVETGATATELFEATGQPQVGPSLVAGAAKGVLEAFTPSIIAKATGLDDIAASGLRKAVLDTFKGASKARVAKAAGSAALAEGTTEGLQEAADIAARRWVDANYDALGPEAAERVLNAVAGGALFGGAVGSGVSAIGGRTAKEEEISLGDWTRLATQNVPEEFGGSAGAVAQQLPGEIETLGTRIEEAQTQERSLLKGGQSLVDFETPGSHPLHQVLGFELLPEQYRGVSARNKEDLRMASLTVAMQELTSQERLTTQLMERKLPKKEMQKLDRERQNLSGLIELLRNPIEARLVTSDQSAYAALLRENNPELWLTHDNINEYVMALAPQGYSVGLSLDSTRAVLRRINDGSTVFEFPNTPTYSTVVPFLIRADSGLRSSRWYEIAGSNIGKLETLTNDGLDLSAYEKSKSDKFKLKMLREATGIVAPDLGPTVLGRDREAEKGRAILEADGVRFNQWNRWWNTVLQWRDKNPLFSPLSRMVDVLTHNKALSHRIVSKADDTLKKFMKLGKEQQEAAFDFIDALVKQTYLTEQERQDGTRRWYTPEEYQALAQGRNRGQGRSTTPLLKETEEAVSEMRALSDEVFDQWVSHRVERAQQLSDAKARLQTLKGIQRDIDLYRSRPRFPFASMGQYTVEVWTKEEEDKGGQLVAALQVESRADQIKARADFEKRYSEPQYVIRESRWLGNEETFVNMPEMVIRELAKNKYLKLDPKTIEVLVTLANADPAQRRRFINPMNPKKRSVELQRAFAHFAQTSANALFKARVTPLLTEIKSDVSLARRKGTSTNQLGVLEKAMEEQIKHVLSPAPDAAKVRAMAFNFHLAFVPASAAVNALQPFMVTTPYLASRFGDISAVRAMQKAYMDKRSLFLKGVHESSEQMDRLLSLGIQEGKIDEGQATELASLAEGQNLSRMLAGSKWDRFMKEVSYYGSYLFSSVEKVNRSVTFRAAADLALRNPNAEYLATLVRQNSRKVERLTREGFSPNEIKAYLAGVDAIDTTQFEYATWNRPKFMRGRFGGSVMTFWMFTQGMLHFATHSPGAMRYWLIMLATAGLMGLPGAGDIKELVKAIASRLGYNFDPEVVAREYIKTVLNPMLSEHVSPKFQIPHDMLLHGLASNGFGLGALGDAIGFPYLPRVDLSRSLSMGRVSPVPPEVFRVGVEYNRALADTTERVAGAAFGPVFALAEATLWEDKLPFDDFKRWEKAMPRALRGFLKAGRVGLEGGERTRTGAEIVDFDPMDPGHNAELVAVALGFQPARLAKAWDKSIALQDASNYWDTRKAMLLSQLDYARYMRDKEGYADVKAKIKSFNTQLPEHFKLKRISSETIQRSLRERQRRRAGTEKGIPVQKSDRPAQRYFNELYE